MDHFFKYLEHNNYFIGIMMILLNIGSKYFIQEFGSSVDFVFNTKIIRRLLLFTVFFVATRDIKTSLILTAIFIILAFELFNEKSDMCILPQRIIHLIDQNNDGKISKDELDRAIHILQKSGYLKNMDRHPNLVEDEVMPYEESTYS